MALECLTPREIALFLIGYGIYYNFRDVFTPRVIANFVMGFEIYCNFQFQDIKDKLKTKKSYEKMIYITENIFAFFFCVFVVNLTPRVIANFLMGFEIYYNFQFQDIKDKLKTKKSYEKMMYITEKIFAFFFCVFVVLAINA